MSFKELYGFVQSQEIHIDRNSLKAEAIRICGIEDVKFVRSGLDTTICRGYWLTPKNTEHHLVRQFGCHVAVTARGLNRCWERFVTVKEMMHLFDGEGSRTRTPDEFEDLLAEFSSPMVNTSEQMISEIASFWRTLAVLCPEKRRQEFMLRKSQNEIDDYAIALRLMIPEAYVPRLFEKRYEDWLEQNLS